MSERSIQGSWVIGVHGDLDAATSDNLQSMDPGPFDEPLVLDLSDCTFLDSSGFRAIARLARTSSASGRQAVAVCPPSVPIVRKVIDLLGLALLVPVIDSLPDALARNTHARDGVVVLPETETLSQ